MEFQFAKYTEITDFVFSVSPNLKEENYVRFFICPDVWDFWYIRILKGYEYDEEEGFVQNEESYILERNKIEMYRKGENLTIRRLKSIIEEDDFSNWDLLSGYNLEELIDKLDGGFGILNRKEVVAESKSDEQLGE